MQETNHCLLFRIPHKVVNFHLKGLATIAKPLEGLTIEIPDVAA